MTSSSTVANFSLDKENRERTDNKIFIDNQMEK